MAPEWDSGNRRIEWAILLLGLAGIAAIWLPFSNGISPYQVLKEALPSNWRDLTIAGPALLPIAASTLQLWRCFDRKADRIAAAMVSTFAVLATGCTTYFAYMEISGAMFLAGDHPFGGGVAALGLVAGNLAICGRLLMLNRKRGSAVPAECLLLGAYIAHAILFIVAYGVADPEVGVFAAGLACAVYAVSVLRRLRRAGCVTSDW